MSSSSILSHAIVRLISFVSVIKLYYNYIDHINFSQTDPHTAAVDFVLFVRSCPLVQNIPSEKFKFQQYKAHGFE